jgi:hypothetical protein
MLDDQRVFMRELLLRFQRSERRHESFLDAHAERLLVETRAARDAAEATREESKAVVAGLMRMIDRLGPGNGPATA